jgi:melibiose permease
VDYGEIKNGRRDESVIFSMQTFVVKLASGVAALVAAVCLSVFNISNDSGSDISTVSLKASSVVGLRLTMSVIPAIVLCLALLLFIRKYSLDEKTVLENAKTLRKKRDEKNTLQE